MIVLKRLSSYSIKNLIVFKKSIIAKTILLFLIEKISIIFKNHTRYFILLHIQKMKEIQIENLKELRFNIVKDILLQRTILWRYLAPKNNKNIKIEDFNLFPIEYWFTQDNWKNIHYIQHIYKYNKVSVDNLQWLTTICFDVDIWDDKICKNKWELFNRINIVNKRFWFKPHYIIKTTWGFHIYFNLSEIIEYKVHKIIIDKVYNYLIKELLWDEWFTRKISTLKYIGWYDFSDKKTNAIWNVIIPEKIYKHKKYSINDIYDFYNKISSNQKTIEHSIFINEKKIERNLNYRYSVNDCCPYEVTQKLWIYDEKNNWLKWDRSVKIRYNKKLWKYCIKEHNWWSIDLYQVVLEHYKYDYTKLKKFFYENYWLLSLNKDNFITLPKIILTNILLWDYQIDEEKLKNDYKENYEKIIQDTHILNNGKLNYKIIFLLLNILSHLNQNHQNNIIVENISFSEIFKNSNVPDSHIYVSKIEYLKYFTLMKYLYTEIPDFKNEKSIIKVYLIGKFEQNNNNYNFYLFNELSDIKHQLQNVKIYIPKLLLNYDKKVCWLLVLFLSKIIERKEIIEISYEEIYNYTNQVYNERYLVKIKSNIIKKFKLIEKYTKLYCDLYFKNNKVIIEKKSKKISITKKLKSKKIGILLHK